MHQIAVFLHLVHWDVTQGDAIQVGDGIRLCRSKGSSAYALYEVLHASQGRQGEKPFEWAAHLEIDAEDRKWLYDFGGHRSVVSRLCNVITIALRKPVGHSTLIASEDGFRTNAYSDKPHDYTLFQSDLIYVKQPTVLSIDDARAESIQKLWDAECELRRGDGAFAGNVASALDYLLYSWRAYYHDQACINLCVVLEQLFSPNARTELTHRIAFNASRFLGDTPLERQRVYDSVRDYYDLRSRIVHGDRPKQSKLEELTPRVFGLCVNALGKILPDPELRHLFSEKKLRDTAFKEWLFE